MPLSGINRGTGGNTTAATSIAIVPGANFASGSMAILALAYDNSGASGADPFTSISDNTGNTWTSRDNRLNDPGAASAGSTLRIFTTAVGTLGTGTTITVNFGSSTTAKSWTLTEVTAAVNFIPFFITNGGATGTSTTPTVTTGSITNGDMVFGAMANEGNATVTADSDTTNGTWSTQQTVNNGTGTGGMQVASQFKVVNATATQTYNLTLSASGDWAIGWIQLREVPALVSTDPFGMMGFFGI